METTVDKIESATNADNSSETPARSTTSFGSRPGYEGHYDKEAAWTVAEATERVARSKTRIFGGGV